MPTAADSTDDDNGVASHDGARAGVAAGAGGDADVDGAVEEEGGVGEGGEGGGPEDADATKLELELMRPHVGSRVRALVGGGALREGEVGEVVEDDRSPIPFKVRGVSSGASSWYKAEQLEHLATYTVSDVLLQRQSLQVYESITEESPFAVDAMRFSWQPSQRVERTRSLLNPRMAGPRLLRNVGNVCCPWCLDPRNRPLMTCILYIVGMVAFVVGFTTVHALGYRHLKIMLERDKYQLRYGRNDGCLATQQMLGVVHRGLAWPRQPLPADPGDVMGFLELVPYRLLRAHHQHGDRNP
jgi:hypothetical protein